MAILKQPPELFCKKMFLENSQNLQKNTSGRVSFLIKLQACRVSFLIKLQACNFIKKETLAQVFSYEFCEISKNTFSYRKPPVAASGYIWSDPKLDLGEPNDL